uniref:Uncharacterized protein n=1 Tax=Musa acuminata subsp. malaccensis TaxID=214687 RepID=A0A804JKT8_MUSAM
MIELSYNVHDLAYKSYIILLMSVQSNKFT